MKVSVKLDKEKVNLAKKLSGIRTLTDLLNKALDAYIAQSRRESMLQLLGTGFFNQTTSLPKMRTRRESNHE